MQPRTPVGIETDFSVVLFRSDFTLFSEKNRMKVHKNQWVLTMPYPLERLAGATSRGQTMAPERQKPSHSGYASRNSHEICTHNLLCTKHFHGVPFASPHAYC